MGDIRTLVISHNCFSNNTNMGKTLKAYFDKWDKDSLAELYFHSEIPNDKVCCNYYRFTDVDAIKSIFLRHKYGTILNENDVDCDLPNTRVDSGNLRRIYEFGRKRKPAICFLRDLIWQLSCWNNKKLQNWIDLFNPEIIFLAAGDYAFPYRIALKISKMRKIPMVLCCFDDYFINYQHKREVFRKVYHNHLMKIVNKTLNNTCVSFALTEKMAKDYTTFFNNKWDVLRSASVIESNNTKYEVSGREGISYIGNLGYNRYLQLIEIGNYLKINNFNGIPKYIDVYSNETRKDILKKMTLENGILFHGPVNQNEVKQILYKSLALIHVESFDLINENLVRYSMSTKIADSLACGTPLIAFGPPDIASIEYLINNKCAIVATKREELKLVFTTLSDVEKVNDIINNALTVAKNNHSQEGIQTFLRENLQKALNNKGDTK